MNSCGCSAKLFCKRHYSLFVAHREEIVSALTVLYQLPVNPLTIASVARRRNAYDAAIEQHECHPSVCSHGFEPEGE